MKGSFRKSMLFIAILCLGILIGIEVRPSNQASIRITNRSHNMITQVKVIASDSTVYFLENINLGESKSTSIFVAGELDFSLDVCFDTGDTVKGGNYVESGDKLEELVFDSEIVSK